MDSYAIVKGGPELLNEYTRKEFLGLRETNVGFEALTDNVDNIKQKFQDILIERASLEDIMYYTRG